MRHRLWEHFRAGGRNRGTQPHVQCRARRRGAFHVGAIALVVSLVAPFATAQLPPVIPPNTIIVSPDDPAADAATVREGVELALQRAYQTGDRVAVWIDAGEYQETGPVRIPGDANIHILGLTGEQDNLDRPGGRPWEVAIDGGAVADGSGVFEIHTERAPAGGGDPWLYYRYEPGDEDGAGAVVDDLSNILIEGVTIRNGQYRVRILGSEAGEPAIRPTLSRCIILGASHALMLPGGASAGVLVEGNAAPLLANCSIGGYSNAILPEIYEEDDEIPEWAERLLDRQYSSKVGVWIRTPNDPDAGLYADVLFCTVLLNQDYGIYVENGANARVRNSIVYRNGDGRDIAEPAPGDPPFADEGGLVWADEQIVLEPDHGPYHIPTVVRIHGRNLVTSEGDAANARVFFGPTSRAETAAIVNAAASTVDMIEVTAPASYLGKPGPVDVHVIRDDGLAFMLRHGFTYTGTATSVPEVAAAIPESGPVRPEQEQIDPEQRGGNWTTIIGAGFERDARVYFDFDDDGAADPDEVSERVLWLSSSKLYVKAPERTVPTGKVDVLVVNPGPPEATSPPGPMKEYQYVEPVEDTLRPDIVDITPNFYRDLLGTPDGVDPVTNPDDRDFTADIVGWNFGPDTFADGAPKPVIVKIGGVICSYGELRQGPDNPNGDSYDEIRDVVVPIAAFGAAGSYDVEVINYDGERDVLADGFTYYADGTPDLGGGLVGTDGEALDVVTAWRPANFVSISTVAPIGPNPQPRSLLGAGFDTGLTVTLSQPVSGASKVIDAAGDSIVLPTETVEQHLGHTQDRVSFAIPLDASTLGAGFTNAFGTADPIVEFEVRNAQDAAGNPSGTSSDLKAVTTEMVYATNRSGTQQSGECLYFEILRVDSIKGLHANAAVPPDVPPAFANYEFRMRVRNWLGTRYMRLFVAGREIPGDALHVGQPGSAPFLGESDVYFTVSDVIPQGLYGPLDVTLLLDENATFNRSGRPLYWVAEGAIWAPRTDDTRTLAPPRLWSVSPRLIPVEGGVDVTLLGADFIPPGSGLARLEQPVQNASFETGPAAADTPPATVQLPAGSPELPGWTIGMDGIRYVHDPIPTPAYEGTRCIQLVRDFMAMGSVEQTGIPTEPGARYEFVFAHGMHHLTPNGPNFGRVAAYVSADGGQTVTYARPTGAALPGNPRWTVRVLGFTATEATTTIRLSHGSMPGGFYPSQYGTLVDAVKVFRVLEDGTRVRIWADDGSGVETPVPLMDGDHVTNYTVSPPSQIDFLMLDLTLDPILGLAVNHNTPLDVEVYHDDGFGAPIVDADGTPLAHRLTDAVVLVSGYVPPTVEDLFRADLAAAGIPDARYGTVDGGDLLQIDGAGFNRGGDLPVVRIGSVEGRVLEPGSTYTARDGNDYTAADLLVGNTEPGTLLVVTPPAVGAQAGTVGVTLIVDDPAFPDHVFETNLPDDLAYTYVADGPPVIAEVRPNFISREASDAGTGTPTSADPDASDSVYFTILGRNFDDKVLVRFYVDDDDDGVPDERGEAGPEDDVYVREHFSVSPTEIVVLAPSATTDLLLAQADFDNGLGSGSAGIVGLRLEVRNQPPSVDPLTEEDEASLTSAPADLYYIDDVPAPGLRTPVLEFNNVHLNYRDYVNVKPGMASLSTDPLFDPGPVPVSTPGPQMVQADALDWWLGKLALREDTYHSPMRDRAGNFVKTPYSFEDLEFDGRPDAPDSDIQGTGPTEEDTGDSGEPRRARLPDIGADEISDPNSLVDLAWYYAEVTPNPIGRITTEGGIYVDVRVRGLRNLNAATRLDGGVETEILPPPAHRMFILTQGALQAAFAEGGRVNPENNPEWVSEELIPRSVPIEFFNLGGGHYVGTNARPIETIIAENAAKTPLLSGIPTQGDVLADGHAALFIYVPEELKKGSDELLGFTSNYHSQFPSVMSDATDAQSIVEQAVWGRHFIIDTVPPRVYIEWYDGAMFPWRSASAEDPRDVFPRSGHNDNTTTNASIYIPLWLLPPVALGGGVVYSPADLATVAPIEYGGAVMNLWRRAGVLPKPEEDAQIFYNVGSISNGLAPDNLSVTVRARLIDPHLTETPTSPYYDTDSGLLAGRTAQMGPPYNFDPYTGMTTRVVAGFSGPLYNFSTALQGTSAIDELSHMFSDAEATWVIEQGAPFIDPPGGSGADAPEASGAFSIAGQEQTGSGAILPPLAQLPTGLEDPTLLEANLADILANRGYAPFAPADTFDYGNNTLLAEWVLDGIDWDGVSSGIGGQNFLRLALRFMGRDRAGNQPPLGDLLDPITAWWTLQSEAIITTGPDPLEGTTLPAFEWKMNRDYDPETAVGPRPIYRWGIYVTEPGDAMNGVYRSLGWSSWSPETTLDAATFANFLEARGIDTFGSEFWVIFVVLSADESGNVERWYSTVPDVYNGEAQADAGAPLFSPLPSSDDVHLIDLRYELPGGLLREQWVEKLPNIWRFLWSGIPRPDTVVRPTFYHGTRPDPWQDDLGANPYVELPVEAERHVHARFQIIANAQVGPGERILVAWDLLREGQFSVGGVIDPADAAFNPIQMWPADVTVADQLLLGDEPARIKPVSYVLRAAAFVDGSGDPPLLNGAYDPGERIDPTWANVSFIVTPRTADQRVDPDVQVIKESEEQ